MSRETRYIKLMNSYHIRPSIHCVVITLISLLFIGTNIKATAKGSRGGEAQPPLVAADFTVSPKDQALDLFLLVGQSNMKGRGEINMEPTTNTKLFFLHPTKLQWFIARDPLHALGTPDKIDGSDNSGTGPGMSFATALLEQKDQGPVGLIPAAKGGVPISSYAPDGKLYKLSLTMLKQAREQSPTPTKLKAILWLQGESDSMNKAQLEAYEAQLLDLVDRYRRDLKQPELPFIACTIGSFIAESSKAKRFKHTRDINEILLRLPTKRKHTACVDARDLKGHIGDSLHYNTESQIEIGKRFAKVYRTLIAEDTKP